MELEHASIPKTEVLRYLGYRGQVIDEPLLERIDAIISDCESTIIPRGVFRIFEIDAWNAEDEAAKSDSKQAVETSDKTFSKQETESQDTAIPRITLKNSSFSLQGKSIAKHFTKKGTKPYAVALIACTLGAQSEQVLRRMSSIDPVAGLIYDACFSALIECATDALEGKVAEAVASIPATLGQRYSPGYGDLPLTSQPALLRSVGAENAIGLTYTENNLLVPTKSVTAIIGIYRADT